jgi:hypothetical protein
LYDASLESFDIDLDEADIVQFEAIQRLHLDRYPRGGAGDLMKRSKEIQLLGTGQRDVQFNLPGLG